MSLPASMHLDGYVRHGEVGEASLVGLRRLRRVGNNGGNDAKVSWAEPPNMQVCHSISANLQSFLDACGEPHIRNCIEQHRSR